MASENVNMLSRKSKTKTSVQSRVRKKKKGRQLFNFARKLLL